jgi:predicted small secreted protein
MRTSSAVVVLLSLLVAACGITTSPDRGLADDIEAAAEATAELDFYEFSWTADYELTEAETGRR